MKSILALALLVNVTAASATSYWYDYCDVTKAASDFVVSNEEGQSVNTQFCNRTAYVFPETATCLQSLKSTYFFGNRATYSVSVKTEQGQNYDVVIKAKLGRTEMCKITSVSFSN